MTHRSRIRSLRATFATIALLAVTTLTATLPAPTAAHAAANPQGPRAVMNQAPTTAARRALFYAYFQQGKPYVLGAGRNQGRNNAFDCSGLVWRSYLSAGINLTPYTTPWSGSIISSSKVRRISASEVRPGDLIRFTRPYVHMGIALGNGWMLESSKLKGRVTQTYYPSLGHRVGEYYRVIA